MTGVSALDFNFSFHCNDLYMKTNELSFLWIPDFVMKCTCIPIMIISGHTKLDTGEKYSTIS